MTFRLLASVSLALALAAPALARTGPEIAYATATELYLVNPDGSGRVRLYRSKSNDFISSLSLKPGGGEIAFVENWRLKFITYDAAGRQIGAVKSLGALCPNGNQHHADVHYSPDGTSVLYKSLCAGNEGVSQVAVPTAANPQPTPTTVLTKENLLDIGWDPSGTSFVYSYLSGTQIELSRRYLDGSPDPAPLHVVGGSNQIRYPDVSNDGGRILIASSPLMAGAYPGPGFTSEIDASSGAAIRSNFISGRKANYAPDGVRIVFIAQQSFSELYLRYRDADGQVRQIGGRAKYSAVDWGN